MTATAMTFYVKNETADGSLNLIPCFGIRVRSSRTQRINAKWGARHGVEDAGGEGSRRNDFQTKIAWLIVARGP